jgi:thiazole synthase
MAGTQSVLIIGGGVIGLAIATELQQRGLSVTVLSRDHQEAASHAAAGMLAPQAEGIPPGSMRELSQRSLARYPDWIQKLEALTGQDSGYWPSGILAPLYHAPDADAAKTAHLGSAHWLGGSTLRQYQPDLSPDTAGGWWFPEEGQVDPRALMHTLQTAAQDCGVTLRDGVNVTALPQHQGHITHACTSLGNFQADHYVLATGAWTQDLLPIPVTPRKGQMMSVQVPLGHPDPQPLKRVLFGEEIYIVPRRDGRIVLGATSEPVGFTPGNTPAGLGQLIQAACRLYPPLADFPICESWWGFRPSTPDELPILGPGPSANLMLAVGHYRNGILLAPATAHLLADAIQGHIDPLLEAFSWQRFQSNPVQSHPAPPFLITQPMPLLNSPSSAATPAPKDDVGLTDTPLEIAGRQFHSRLMTGTGKYDDFAVMRRSVAASGCEIITVAVRRVQTNAPGHQGLAEALDWGKIWMLPNTAGCKTAEEAVRVARLGREMAKLLGQEDNNFVKLEVIPDAKYLLPDPIGTLEAAEQLVKEGFAVLPYINADPLLAKRLEEAGCATVMPLGSPIGSGQGVRNAANIEIIIENARVPVVVDAGLGTPSEAAEAMEMGADALLINTAIAKATNPVAMGKAMGMACEAGRLAYLAGRIPVQGRASASSPLTGRITD